MVRCSAVVAAALCLLQAALAVKVKVVMHSEQDDSRIEEEESPPGTRADLWERRPRVDVTFLPFIKKRKHDEKALEYEEERTTTERARPLHPNDMIFPLIYRQSHINSMFKFGENWYTWSAEKRSDGSKAVNYYICYDEPKRCDEVGWERTDSVPRCAFQIDSVMADDRACLNTFGVEPRPGPACDGGEQMKVSDIVHSCGPRIRSLWRFVRVGRRSPTAAKPADVNSLVCEDEEECFLTIEYRIHHDRITFSLHEPARGQTFKSMLKREQAIEETATETRLRRGKKARDEEPQQRKKFSHVRVKGKPVEGKGAVRERDESGAGARRGSKNKIKIREDISEDLSE